MVIPATTTEYIHIPITPPTGVDLTGTLPKIAILPVSNRTNPGPTDWHTGEWATTTEARLLIGPDSGTLTLTAGDYRVWISVAPPGSEPIVRVSGYLNVT